MGEEQKAKLKNTALAVISLGVIPFVGTLIAFLKEGSDLEAPVKFKHLLLITGLYLLVAVALFIKIQWFTYARLG